jgi:Fur family ferric uptake transcriptional regulator
VTDAVAEIGPEERGSSMMGAVTGPPTDEEGADLHVEVGHRLAESGQRYSPVRRQIIEALAKSDRPQSVADLVTGVPELAVSSAYRNLGVLADAGAVTRVATDDDAARFELAEAVTERHHHHLVCTQCGLVLDYDPPVALERQVASGLDSVARACGFVPESHRLDLFGRCSDCVE